MTLLHSDPQMLKHKIFLSDSLRFGIPRLVRASVKNAEGTVINCSTTLPGILNCLAWRCHSYCEIVIAITHAFSHPPSLFPLVPAMPPCACARQQQFREAEGISLSSPRDEKFYSAYRIMWYGHMGNYFLHQSTVSQSIKIHMGTPKAVQCHFIWLALHAPWSAFVSVHCPRLQPEGAEDATTHNCRMHFWGGPKKGENKS